MNDSLLPACYMVFSGDDNSPAGGMRDLHSIHNSLDDAMASVARLDCGDWWHLAVVDDRGTHIAARGAIEVDDNDTVIVSIVDIGALSGFTLLHASVVGFFVVRRRAAGGWWHLAVPVAGALITGWVLVEASALAQGVGAAWLALGVVYAVASRPLRRPA